MKFETKYKILRFVRKMLGFPTNPPYIQIETKRINRIVFQHYLSQREFDMMSEDQMKGIVRASILHKLEDTDAIKIEVSDMEMYPGSPSKIIRAELNYITPLK